ncbi:hypothetical protein AaE_010215 [Aphanomyces astaci]|uniref:mRNA-decapping enzyme C-terminal domain-containing protein n=1 Tax=Aphanomyces astaci TaxID=112090 RepID=A0A6A5A2W5_APHAT|nr:hypothetical protein AaE_010215 [Aphanomyces astaci]
MAALPVDTSQTDALNLQVLQRQDNQISDIVGTASHVVVYEFDQTEQSWVRMHIQYLMLKLRDDAEQRPSSRQVEAKRSGRQFVHREAVRRYSAPRFQMFVNNRLSTSNLTISIDAQLNVDNVDDFLILRCVDPAAPSTFKIYGIWFFPEEDRQKTLKLLERVLVTLKGTPPPPAAAKPSPKNAAAVQQKGASRQPAHEVQSESKPLAASSSSQGPVESPKNGASSTVVYSKAEGIAAGVAIMGMISQQPSQGAPLAEATTVELQVASGQPQPQTRQKKQRDRASPRTAKPPLTKDQFKEAFVQCLDDPAFLDQIYQAFAKKLPKQQQ